MFLRRDTRKFLLCRWSWTFLTIRLFVQKRIKNRTQTRRNKRKIRETQRSHIFRWIFEKVEQTIAPNCALCFDSQRRDIFFVTGNTRFIARSVTRDKYSEGIEFSPSVCYSTSKIWKPSIKKITSKSAEPRNNSHTIIRQRAVVSASRSYDSLTQTPWKSSLIALCDPYRIFSLSRTFPSSSWTGMLWP